MLEAEQCAGQLQEAEQEVGAPLVVLVVMGS
jgi:hypothetical protein